MPFYLLTLPDSVNIPLLGGARSRIIHAASSADAIAGAKSMLSWDSDAGWDAATVTVLSCRTDMSGITIKAVCGSNADSYLRPYSYTGVANDKLNELLDGLAAAMNADTTNFPSTVTVSGEVLTIPSGNNMGDLSITCELNINGVVISGITSAVSATGAEASARTITLSGGSLAGVRWNVTVADPTNPVDVSVYSHAGETIDLLAARLVVLLNATALLSNVSYAANVITIEGATDAQGAKVITATATRDGAALPELALTVNAAGVSSIDRTITFPADGTLPVPIAPCALSTVSVA